MNTTIRAYTGGRDRDVADLILSIQNGEAGLNLSIDDQPDLRDIANEYRDGGFWIAPDDRDAIVGSIGLLTYGLTGVLKKFFVARSSRGKGGPALALLEALMARARALGVTHIMLDTPAVATRSHAFYERNGFRRAAPGDMPAGYRFPDRDSILYRLQLESRS
jgi:RimJ/RimL family protein N-acetyltransferase